MSAVLLCLALVYLLQLQWGQALIVTVVACIAQAWVLDGPLLFVCIGTFLLCLLWQQRARVQAWRGWSRLEEYNRWRYRHCHCRTHCRCRRWF